MLLSSLKSEVYLYKTQSMDTNINKILVDMQSFRFLFNFICIEEKLVRSNPSYLSPPFSYADKQKLRL